MSLCIVDKRHGLNELIRAFSAFAYKGLWSGCQRPIVPFSLTIRLRVIWCPCQLSYAWKAADGGEYYANELWPVVAQQRSGCFVGHDSMIDEELCHVRQRCLTKSSAVVCLLWQSIMTETKWFPCLNFRNNPRFSIPLGSSGPVSENSFNVLWWFCRIPSLWHSLQFFLAMNKCSFLSWARRIRVKAKHSYFSNPDDLQELHSRQVAVCILSFVQMKPYGWTQRLTRPLWTSCLYKNYTMNRLIGQ